MPDTHSPRVTGKTREDLAKYFAKLYRGGASIRAIAGQSERSYGFVHRMLLEAGVTLRARGGAQTRSPRI